MLLKRKWYLKTSDSTFKREREQSVRSIFNNKFNVYLLIYLHIFYKDKAKFTILIFNLENVVSNDKNRYS